MQLAALDQLRHEFDLEQISDGLGELVKIVTEGLERTSRLVGDLRDFAAPGEGPEGEIDVRRGLESTFQLMRHAMREAGVELQAELADELPLIPGDARALNQVFLNLLKNGTEALEGRGGTVSVALRQEGRSLVVEVRDDGPGITPELQERLFEPFFSTKAAGRGTGLGLSISSRIVTEHGGSMEVESCEGVGTTFRVRLPIRSGRSAGAGGEEGDARAT
jgi:signal transduction histidine kinase